MMKSKKLKNLGMAAVAVAFFCLTLSSCHRHGCPNKITKIEQKQIENC